MSGGKPFTWIGNQLDCFNWGPTPMMAFGGVGSGKTTVGIIKLLYLLDEYPGSHGAIVRQRGTDLRRTTAATLWKWLPPHAVAGRNDNEGRIDLKNGSQILFVHLDKPDSMNSMKSLELNFAFVDQAEDLAVGAWELLEERLGRWTGAIKRGGYPTDWPYIDDFGTAMPPVYLFGTCYSPGYGHWITSRFWEFGSEREKYRQLGYKTFHLSSRDNRFLSKEYIAARLAKGDEYVRRYVDATEWGASEGTIFHIDEQSIVDPTDLLLNQIHHLMKRHRVYDHGDFSPAACGWFATDAYGNIFMYREYMAANLLLSQHRYNIWEMSQKDGDTGQVLRYQTQLADPIIFDKTRGRGPNNLPTHSVADEWADKVISDPRTAVFWQPADNNEVATCLRLAEFLKIDPNHRNPVTGKMGAPRIYFVRRRPNYPYGCHEVLNDIRNAKRVKLPQVAPDGSALYSDERDETVRDHLLDTVRYFVVSRPSVGREEARPLPEPGTIRLIDYERQCEAMKRDRDRLDRANRPYRPYGRHGY